MSEPRVYDRLPPCVRTEILAAVDRRERYIDIALDYLITEHHVYRMAAAVGHRRNPHLPEHLKPDILSAVDRGEKYRDIATRFNTTRQTISRIAKRAGRAERRRPYH